MQLTISSNTVGHNASPDACRDAILRFLEDELPGFQPEPGIPGAFSAEFPGLPNSRAVVRTFPLLTLPGGVSTSATGARLDITFEFDGLSLQQIAVRSHANEFMGRFEKRLAATVPAGYIRKFGQWRGVGHVVALADAVARHVGEPAAFTDLVERGRWAGHVVRDDGVSVDVELTFRNPFIVADQQGIKVDAAVQGEALDRLGAGRVEALVTETVESIVASMGPATGPAPALYTEVIDAGTDLPDLFYGEAANLTQYMESRGWDGAAWRSGGRIVIFAPQPGLRVELDLAASSGGGTTRNTRVTLRLTTLDAPADAAVRTHWSNFADEVARGLASTARGLEAPSFTVFGRAADTYRAVARELKAAFPQSVVEMGNGALTVRSFALGENVWGALEVHVIAVGEATRVTFTGQLVGLGLPTDARGAAAARAAYRAEVARLAGEISRSLERDPTWPGFASPSAGIA